MRNDFLLTVSEQAFYYFSQHFGRFLVTLRLVSDEGRTERIKSNYFNDRKRLSKKKKTIMSRGIVHA